MNIYNQRRPMASLAFGLVLVCSLTLFGACSPDKPKFNAIDITGANYAKGFSLKDHTGQEWSWYFLATPNAPMYVPPP
jgi:protein SCO1/2